MWKKWLDPYLEPTQFRPLGALNLTVYGSLSDFRRHNLTSLDFWFWRLKSITALKKSHIYNGRIKELTKIFVMISNWKKPVGLHGFYKNYSALQELIINRLMNAICGNTDCNGKQ